ncbi:MAG: 5-formyltetrahydrofolate cyclo-ligase [Burkholderiales bacterium]|nr:5-formyltetrahydrofolate cyclo-ligase [Burkholderiales bacterium]
MPDTTALDRPALRRQLLSARQAWAQTPEAAAAQAQLQARVMAVLAQLEPMCLGLYWPMQGEFNPRDLALSAKQQWACHLALPFARRTPVDMHFRAWDGQTPDTQDECRIPSSSGKPVEPDVVLVPCLGFTQAGFRLGYGGGYFDRYLAAHPGVTAVGVAWQQGLLADGILTPEAHDQALVAVLTENQTYSG